MTPGVHPSRAVVVPKPEMALRGEVRAGHLRYATNLVWTGSSLTGRFGGRFFGERLRLECRAGEGLGTLAGRYVHAAVNVKTQLEGLELNFVSEGGLYRVALELDLDGGYGDLETPEGVQPVELVHESERTILRVTEQRTAITHPEAPRVVGITAALLADLCARIVWREQLETLLRMGET